MLQLKLPDFEMRRYRAGYDLMAVDQAVLRVFEAFTRQPPDLTSENLAALQLPVVNVAASYDQDQVDDWFQHAGTLLDAARDGATVALPSSEQLDEAVRRGEQIDEDARTGPLTDAHKRSWVLPVLIGLSLLTFLAFVYFDQVVSWQAR